MVVASVEVFKVKVGKFSFGSGKHTVVEFVGTDRLASQEPEIALKWATSVDKRVGFVVGVDNLVVRVFGLGAAEVHETESVIAWSISLTGDASAFSEDIVLVCVRYSEVTVGLETKVLCLSAGNVVSFEPLAFGVGLFVPNSHVVLGIEVGNACWHIAAGVSGYGGSEVVKVEVH